MTAVQMLAEVRTLLDEDIQEYWLDTEIYSALGDGQKEYAALVFAMFDAARKIDRDIPLPLTLLPLFTESANILVNTGVSVIPLPSNFWKVIYVTQGSSKPYKPLLERAINSTRPFLQYNSLMNTLDTYYSVVGTQIELENNLTNPDTNYQIGYLASTSTIDAAPTNPVLPDFTHKAIVQYAYAEMLKKPKLLQESLLVFQQFLTMIQYK